MLRALAGICWQAAGANSAERSRPLPPLAELFATAEQHDVAGMLAAGLLAQQPGELAAEVCEGLEIYCEGARLEARRAATQLAEVLDLLAARGLPAMPFKGPVIAHSAYTDPELRESLDLDLMVHPDDVSHVLGCLIDAGFEHQPGLDRDGVAALRRYASEYLLLRPNSVPVEPHWYPTPRTMAIGIDIEALWQRARPADFLGAPCYLPASEDHLLLLAVHGAKEQWHKLKWVLDVAAFLATHPRLDLAALRIAAAAEGCRRIFDCSLVLSHRMFAVPAAAPPADLTTTRLAERTLAERTLARLERTAEAPVGPYVVIAFHWQIRERRRDRLRYAARTLLTPRVPHYRRLPLPSALRWMHVPLKLPWDYLLTPVARAVRHLAAAGK